MKAVLNRFGSNDRATYGRFEIIGPQREVVQKCYTLELPWRSNAVGISCIPEGDYTVVKRRSTKYGDHFHVLNVPGRTWILIHHGNYAADTRGCILPGSGIQDINGDGIPDVINSKAQMRTLNAVLPREFQLTVRWAE